MNKIKELYNEGYSVTEIVSRTGRPYEEIRETVADQLLQRKYRDHDGLGTRGPKPTSLLGKRYNHLIIEKYLARISARNYKVVAVCDCGNRIEAESKDIVLGHTQSCGCREHIEGTLMIGEKTLYEKSKELGVDYSTLRNKLLNGGEVE